MFIPTFQPKSKLKKEEREVRSLHQSSLLSSKSLEKRRHQGHSFFLADELYGEVFQQPDVLLGRGAKTGHPITITSIL